MYKIKQFSLVCFLMIVLLFPFLSRAGGDQEGKKKTFVRPTYEKMYGYMVKGLCLMKKSQRRNLGTAIKDLDNYHALFLQECGYTMQPPPDDKDVVKARTDILPSATTLCERTILYSLYLQLDMLDTVLLDRDPQKAGEMKEKRSKKRMLKAEDKIYGDYRDVFFFLAIDTLKDISDLQNCLGVEGTLEISFPRGLEKAEVEAYTIGKIEAVAKRAQTLLEKE